MSMEKIFYPFSDANNLAQMAFAYFVEIVLREILKQKYIRELSFAKTFAYICFTNILFFNYIFFLVILLIINFLTQYDIRFSRIFLLFFQSYNFTYYEHVYSLKFSSFYFVVSIRQLLELKLRRLVGVTCITSLPLKLFFMLICQYLSGKAPK